jgi:hypothetical protein
VEASLPEIDGTISAFDAAANILRAAGLAHLSGDELVDGIETRLWGLNVNSEDRADEMLNLTMIVESEVFWKVFHRCWSSCDDTWELNDQLVELLSFHHAHDHAWLHMEPQQRAFYDALPKVVTVFRGCSEERIRGGSWTTDVAVARGFARGHRGMSPPNPVVARARMPKSAIFTVLVEREEREIVLDPSELTEIKRVELVASVL